MADFTPINTQEEFDAAIKGRIERERKTLTEKYADYDQLKTKNSEYEKKISELSKSIEDSGKKYADYDKNLADLQNKIKGYETASVKTRIALENGLPYEIANRLAGETEEEIRKDAETFAKLIGSRHQAPLGSTETDAGGDPKTAALREMLHKINNK